MNGYIRKGSACYGECLGPPDGVTTSTVQFEDGNGETWDFVYWEIGMPFRIFSECFMESDETKLPYPLSSPMYYWSKNAFDTNYYEARVFYLFFTVATFLLLDIVFPLCIILNVVFDVNIKLSRAGCRISLIISFVF